MLKLSYNANEIADLESVQKPFMANAVIVKKLSDWEWLKSMRL